MSPPLSVTTHGSAKPTPPEGYTLVRYEVQREPGVDGIGTFTPTIPVESVGTMLVWIPDIKEWVKPKWLIGDEDRWYAVKLRKR